MTTGLLDPDTRIPGFSAVGRQGEVVVTLNEPVNRWFSVDVDVEIGDYRVTCPVVFPPRTTRRVIKVERIRGC